MPRNKKLLLFLIVLIYLILLAPYIIASNAGESGIVIKSQNLDLNSLPDDIKDILIYQKEPYNAILIEDPVTEVYTPQGQVYKERKLIISGEEKEIGSFVKIDNIVADIHVTSYNIMELSFNKLIIGDAGKPEFGTIIESINNFNSNTISILPLILIISKIDYLAGGFLAVVTMTFLYYRRIALWNIPAIVALYSFRSFFAVGVSLLNMLEVDVISMVFSFLFVIAIPLTLWIQRYEMSENGWRKIHGLYIKNKKIFFKNDK